MISSLRFGVLLQLYWKRYLLYLKRPTPKGFKKLTFKKLTFEVLDFQEKEGFGVVVTFRNIYQSWGQKFCHFTGIGSVLVTLLQAFLSLY